MDAAYLRQAPVVLLEDRRPVHRRGRSLLFHSPETLIVARTLDEVPAALARIDACLADGLHLAGWISYECAGAFEPRLKSAIRAFAEEPLIWMMATRHRATVDQAELRAIFGETAKAGDAAASLTFGESVETPESYLRAIEAIHGYIQSGDVYQINHTFPLPVAAKGDALALYDRLGNSQPVAFGAYIDTGETRILSFSPELFVRRDGNRLTSRPMKGTAPRGRTEAEDDALADTLRRDEKQRAENLMIVDLIRNDLSRLAAPGSVRVDELFTVERYSTLLQMTSSVSATVAGDLTPSGMLRALFPCGSITGAPKVRAMEIIAELEKAPRGAYCGAIGHFSPPDDSTGHDWTLNVPIRTLILDHSAKGRLSVGSGVVADSVGGAEYDECLLKARFATREPRSFSLIETLLLEQDGTYRLLDEHMARLASSARYFDFPAPDNEIRGALAAFAADADKARDHRVRLLLDRDGAVSVVGTPMAVDAADAPPPKVCLSAGRTNSGDVFLFHKTTNRALYDTAFTRASGEGYADILFFNERNELTEGAISNVFIVRGGDWFTPRLECGLLPGTLRQALLTHHSPRISETVLSRADLLAADEIYIGNGVRGLRKVSLDPREI